MLGDLWQMFPEPMRLQLERFATDFWQVLPGLIAAMAFVVLAALVIWGIRTFLPGAMRRARMRRALIDVLMMLLTVGLWLATALVAITIAFPNVTPARAVAALGIGGLAVGFAFKDVFENFLAGILLLLREPFQVTDFIECDGIEGQVERITIRDSHIRQTDGQLVVTPNAKLFKEPVVVRTSRDLRRTTIMAGVAYKEDVDEAREVIRRAVKSVDSVRDDVKDVQIFAQAFGASSIDFEVTWWTGSRPVDIRASRDKVVAAIKRALDDAGIEIPFPYRTLTFDEDLPLELLLEKAGRARASTDAGKADGG